MAALPRRNRGQVKKLKRLAYAIAQHHAAQAEPDADKPSLSPGWAQSLATLGLLHAPDADEPAQQIEYLWPCNQTHWALWRELRTQWRMGMGGATGLDYASAIAHLQCAHNLRGKSLQKAWQAIRACEDGTLEAWAEDADRKKANQPIKPTTEPQS